MFNAVPHRMSSSHLVENLQDANYLETGSTASSGELLASLASSSGASRGLGPAPYLPLDGRS